MTEFPIMQGDLVLCPIDTGGWVLAIADQPDVSTGAVVAAWGDVVRSFDPECLHAIPRESLRPEAGLKIGRRFRSVQSARFVLAKFRKG
jgi:hypothetical protein